MGRRDGAGADRRGLRLAHTNQRMPDTVGDAGRESAAEGGAAYGVGVSLGIGVTYARRVDVNHGEIAETFRACGFQVLDLSRLGKGIPDLLVKHGGFWALVEVKDVKGKLRASQEAFRATWPVLVIRTVDEVLALRKRVNP